MNSARVSTVRIGPDIYSQRHDWPGLTVTDHIAIRAHLSTISYDGRPGYITSPKTYGASKTISNFHEFGHVTEKCRKMYQVQVQFGQYRYSLDRGSENFGLTQE